MDVNIFEERFGTTEEHFGEGGFGDVYRSTKGYAIKATKDITNHYLFFREISFTNALSHKNIIDFLGVSEDYEIAMPLAKGNLHEMFGSIREFSPR
jgi:serine/threonine protein kinase